MTTNGAGELPKVLGQLGGKPAGLVDNWHNPTTVEYLFRDSASPLSNPPGAIL